MSGIAEARLVVLCVREPSLSPRALAWMAATPLDWERVLRLARQHRVLSYVRRTLKDHHPSLLPDAVDRRVQQLLLAESVRTMGLDAELGRIARALAAAAAPVLVLKGPALARTLYPSPTLRPYNDIDLVVQEEHEAAVVGVLHAGGFHEIDYEAEVARRAHAGHSHNGGAFHRQFVGNGGTVLVELHLDPLQLGLQPVCERERWQRALALPGVPGALMLGLEDQLVQLSVHAHKHGFNRLIWLKDLDLLVRTHGTDLDWRLIERVARREGVVGSVWYALYLARRLLRTPLPPAATRLQPAAPERLLYRLVWPEERIASLGGYMRRRAVQFHAAESLRGMVPSLFLMGRRRDRLAATARALLPGGERRG
jgi:hypothetical protein